MTVDKRWYQAASDWLNDSDLDRKLITEEYITKLAEILQMYAEQFVSDDIPQMEEDKQQAAWDAHVEQKIDEARGK